MWKDIDICKRGVKGEIIVHKYKRKRKKRPIDKRGIEKLRTKKEKAGKKEQKLSQLNWNKETTKRKEYFHTNQKMFQNKKKKKNKGKLERLRRVRKERKKKRKTDKEKWIMNDSEIE